MKTQATRILIILLLSVFVYLASLRNRNNNLNLKLPQKTFQASNLKPPPSSNHNYRKLFIEYGYFRQVMTNLVYILTTDFSVSYKVSYFKIAFNFISELTVIINISREVSATFNETKQSCFPIFKKLKDQNSTISSDDLDKITEEMKKFFTFLKSDYFSITEEYQNKCQSEMINTEKLIAAQIFEIQRGQKFCFS